MQIFRLIVTGLCMSTFFLVEAREISVIKTADKQLMIQKRFLLDRNYTKAWVTLEQYASCSLTCIPGYEQLTEVCCNTGIDAVCLNLPWDSLKTSLGLCPGSSTFNDHSTMSTVSSLTAAKIALQQFAACSLTCVQGYEKLTEVCCQTGIKDVCSNLPWDILKSYLGVCQEKSSTSTLTLPQQTTTIKTPMSTTRHTTTQALYWFPWGKWHCEIQQGACFQRRFRNCSTGTDKDCIDVIGGVRYSVDICTTSSCPEYFTSTTQPSPSPQGTCHDDANASGCKYPEILAEVCRDKRTAWEICPSSCNLCATTEKDKLYNDTVDMMVKNNLAVHTRVVADESAYIVQIFILIDTCWDYLNCSLPNARKLFCVYESYSIQYCRQSCGKCNNKPVAVRLNTCGDPVAREEICKILQDEICICNDPETRQLCDNYCSNKCAGYPFTGSNCTPAKRRRRDAVLNNLVFS